MANRRNPEKKAGSATIFNSIKISILICLIILSGGAAFGSPDSVSCRPIHEVVWYDVSSGLSDMGRAFCSIAAPRPGWGTRTLCFSAGIGAAYTLDNDIRDAAKRNHSGALDDYFDFTNNFGELIYAASLIGCTYVGGLASGSGELRTTGRLMAESVLFSGIITQAAKMAIGRSRPYLEEGKSRFRPFSLQNKYNSMPSGHSTLVFSLATVVARRVDKWWGYALCYGAAASTAGARVYLDKHWASDVVAGGIIGTVSALTILDANSKDTTRGPGKGVSFFASPAGIGISCSL